MNTVVNALIIKTGKTIFLSNYIFLDENISNRIYKNNLIFIIGKIKKNFSV